MTLVAATPLKKATPTVAGSGIFFFPFPMAMGQGLGQLPFVMYMIGRGVGGRSRTGGTGMPTKTGGGIRSRVFSWHLGAVGSGSQMGWCIGRWIGSNLWRKVNCKFVSFWKRSSVQESIFFSCGELFDSFFSLCSFTTSDSFLAQLPLSMTIQFYSMRLHPPQLPVLSLPLSQILPAGLVIFLSGTSD